MLLFLNFLCGRYFRLFLRDHLHPILSSRSTLMACLHKYWPYSIHSFLFSFSKYW